MSAILSTDTLNDFITPSVACIKPIETLPPNDSQSSSQIENEVEIHDPSNPTTSSSTNAAPPAQISLTDCLACSGCVTSAEAVLVSLQSHSEVLNALDSGPGLRLGSTPDYNFHNGGGDGGGDEEDESIDLTTNDPISEEERTEGKIYVASLSPQSLASLSTTLSLPPPTTFNLIQQFLSGPEGLARGGKYGNKFTWVIDTNAAREACLVLGAEEVLNAREESNGSASSSSMLNGDQSPKSNGDESSKSNGTTTSQNSCPKKPILSSSCPGWICYAEKTHPHILPHLSHLKSPQALTGTILKTVLAKQLRISADRIWHVAIMPCFDKKLEASREELTDLYWDDDDGGITMGRNETRTRKGIRDVDCVITSKELLMLAETRGIDFLSLPRYPLPPSSYPQFPDPELDRFFFPQRYNKNKSNKSSLRRSKKQQQEPAAGTSGGQLWYILNHISSLNPNSTIQSMRGRNADVIDYTVISATGEVIFKAARYYGFRNIQNLVRKLKPARASRMPGAKAVQVGGVRRAGGKDGAIGQEYVEVMACPGGCTNGGGQIKIDDAVVSGRRNVDPLNSAVDAKAGPQEQKEWLARVDEAYFSADASSSSDNETDMEDINSTGSPADEVMINGISPSYIKDILAHWTALTGFPLERLAYTTYREVISDVGKKVSDTERVVQLAGKIGGGW